MCYNGAFHREAPLGNYRNLSVRQAHDPVFDDLTALNKDLYDNSGIGELLSRCDSTNQTFIKIDSSGDFLFDNGEDGGPHFERKTNVWGCFGLLEAQIIANHLLSGKLVFQLEVEGCGVDYFVVIPGKAEEAEPSF